MRVSVVQFNYHTSILSYSSYSFLLIFNFLKTAICQPNSPRYVLKDSLANPAPLGLFGFGMTTVLLNLHNAGFYEMNSMILAMGLFYGGLAQVIAGILEYKKNNTFGMTAFISYGFFWISLVGLIFMAKWGWITATPGNALVAYLIMWGIFTLLLFFGTLRINKALQLVFGSLTILFFLLAIGDATKMNPSPIWQDMKESFAADWPFIQVSQICSMKCMAIRFYHWVR